VKDNFNHRAVVFILDASNRKMPPTHEINAIPKRFLHANALKVIQAAPRPNRDRTDQPF